MSTPSNADRTKATRIRGRMREQKPISEADRIWLADYESKQKRPGNTRAIAPAPAPSSPPRSTAPRTQLAAEAAPTGAHVQTTAPETGALDPATFTWAPTVPPPTEGAEPPPPGAPPPPKVGAPAFEPGAGESAPPPGDPAAAKQFALLVGFFVGMGIRAGRELLGELGAVPEEVRVLLASEEAAAGVLETVQLSAERVAMKHGFTGVPMGDEAVVVAAIVGSGMLVAKNMKRKKLGKAPDAPLVEEKKAPETVLDGLWASPQRGGS